MLGPISAYQIQQQSVQSTQVRNPNSQPFLAQEQNLGRTERLNETRHANEPLADANDAHKGQKDLTDISEDQVKNLLAQGSTERGSLVDLLA